VSRILGNWVIWIYEELQLDQLCLFHFRPNSLVHILVLKNKKNGVGFLRAEGVKAAEDLESLLIAIVQIDLAQQ
jgi:hypothetical protein